MQRRLTDLGQCYGVWNLQAGAGCRLGVRVVAVLGGVRVVVNRVGSSPLLGDYLTHDRRARPAWHPSPLSYRLRTHVHEHPRTLVHQTACKLTG